MTDQELQQQRAHIWHTDGHPISTVEDARGFVDSVGLCLMYPERSLPQTPTFLAAYAGSASRLPDAKHAFADPRTREATELLVRLLRERSAFEASLNGSVSLILSAEMFPYYYALVSDRNPKSPPRSKAQGIMFSPLAIT